MSRAGEPIPAAYEQTGAASVVCPRCGAESGVWCRDHHGRPTRVPHVQRCAAARPQAARAVNDALDEVTPRVRTADCYMAEAEPVQQLDFGEPRRPWGDG